MSEANPNANYSYSLRLMHLRLRLHNAWMSFHSMASSLHARGKVQARKWFILFLCQILCTTIHKTFFASKRNGFFIEVLVG